MDETISTLQSLGLLVPIITVLIALLVLVKTWIDKQIEKIKADERTANIAGAVAKANDSIWTVVMQLAQETVDNLKAAAADGKLTPEEITQLRDTAYARSIELMGQQAYGLLQSYTEDVRTWIYTKIDALSRLTKLPTQVPCPAGPVNNTSPSGTPIAA